MSVCELRSRATAAMCRRRKSSASAETGEISRHMAPVNEEVPPREKGAEYAVEPWRASWRDDKSTAAVPRAATTWASWRADKCNVLGARMVTAIP